MKKLIVFILLFPAFFLPVNAQDIQDSVLEAEREYYWNRYTSIRDTLTINTWNNLKRMKDNLEQVVDRDALIIESLKQRHETDSSLVVNQADMNARYNELAAAHDVVQSRVKNDMQMMLYLKAAVGVLLLIVVILIFTLTGWVSSLKKARSRADHYESLAEQRNQMNELQESELRRLKEREIEFREELEKGIQAHQERLISIQQRNNELEHEIEELKNAAVFVSQDDDPVQVEGGEVPNDNEELRQWGNSLLDERNSLLKLAEQLKHKVAEEKARRERLLEKIRNLAGSLSGLDEDISE
ncbi:MAG: hypothetical protein RBS33_08425 [Lentimicrobium sp.]|jgi:hypothetical protein|nr:hypothetical protein [Lentimicrobiaceae bacterium]MDY0025994.1 hypothetical protein [Lentimicrobium sp.]